MDPNVHIEMKRFKKTILISFIFQLKNIHHTHVIIQTLNTFFLHQHYENYDHNLQMFHILCFIETKIHHTSIGMHEFINSSKYSYVSNYNDYGLMMMYDIHMHLYSFNTTTGDGSKYITTNFNTNT
jgi:hypothetical protein